MSKYDHPYEGVLNGWYECVVHSNVYMTKGKLYFFEDGVTTYDNGTLSSRCDSVNHFNSHKIAKIKKNKKAEAMDMNDRLNGLYLCTVGFKDYMTEGKIYSFVDGQYTKDNGEQSAVFASVENYNRWCKSSITPAGVMQPDTSKLRSGDKLVKRDGKISYVLVEVDRIYDENGNSDTFLTSYHPNLKWQTMTNSQRDVMEVYRGGELIMKRIEQSAKDLEIERIEKEMRELSAKQDKLADDLKKVRR